MNRIDKYEILSVIGRGGLGTVYKAFHPQLKKYVAIKEINADLADRTEFQLLFGQEIELLAKLPSHPNIVTMRDALVWQDRFFLVMDHIDGADLNVVIQRGPVDPSQGTSWLGQILAGLAAIHQRGIVHRDLKPSNILIDQEGIAYISDFGIAEHVNSALSDMLTAKYAAPELIDPALNRAGRKEQVDIYAAGMLTYEMFLGPSRFRSAFAEVYQRQEADIPESWLVWHTDLAKTAPKLSAIEPRISNSLALLVERMMAKDVNERYLDATEARRDLKNSGGLADDYSGRSPAGQEDLTVPIARLRPQSGRGSERGASQSVPPPIRRDSSRKDWRPGWLRRIPKWALLVAVALAFFLLQYLLSLLMRDRPGLTLIVQGVSATGEVYIDGVRRGTPQMQTPASAAPVGSINVYGLKADQKYSVKLKCGDREVRLFRDGNPFDGALQGKDGQKIEISGEKCGVLAPPATPPAEIDYRGPMVLVSAGEFIMGDDNGPPEERPAHRVSVPAFYIDKYEVTNQKYRQYCVPQAIPLPSVPQDSGKDFPWLANYYDIPNAPVFGMSWKEAQACADQMGKRLPTEAEWEKAASWGPGDSGAVQKYKYPWGNQPDSSKARLASDQPVPVDSYPSDVSRYGVIGMAGNVYEWVLDIYRPYPYIGALENNSPAQLGQRVARGRTFQSMVEGAITTYRGIKKPPDQKNGTIINGKTYVLFIGFRCAVSADDPRIQQYISLRK